jgi:hypothetical protein
MMASTLADSASRSPSRLSDNPSKKRLCLQANAATIASTYSYPHHHTVCHGHHVAAPAEHSVDVAVIDSWAEFASHKAPVWLAHQSDPALRPPQA